MFRILYDIVSCTGGCVTGCTGPDGSSIANGASKTYYASSSVGCGGSCSSETRTCNSGSLSGSYTASSCSVAACSSCTGPDGSSIAHGSGKTYYYSSSVGCGGSCSWLLLRQHLRQLHWTRRKDDSPRLFSHLLVNLDCWVWELLHFPDSFLL